MDPVAARDLLEGVSILFEERGGSKGAVPEEQPTIDFAFATIVAIKDIKKGEVFSKDNLWVKRPGTGGIKAEFFNDVLNKKALKNISIDTHLKWSDVEK
jgi:N-acetylneuraminate synthase